MYVCMCVYLTHIIIYNMYVIIMKSYNYKYVCVYVSMTREGLVTKSSKLYVDLMNPSF